MTKLEIIAGLEGLKDFVNDNGKKQIDGLKAAVNTLEDASAGKKDAPDEEEHHSKKAHR